MSTIFFWVLEAVARVVRSCTELSGTLLGRRRAPQLMDHTSGVPPHFALDVPALDDLDPVSYMLLGREVLPPYDSQDSRGHAALLRSDPAVRLEADHASGAPPHFAPGGPALGDPVPVSLMLPGSELIPPHYGSQDQGYVALLRSCPAGRLGPSQPGVDVFSVV